MPNSINLDALSIILRKLSHDLKNEMTPIYNGAERLQKILKNGSIKDEKISDMANKISHHTLSMARWVDGVAAIEWSLNLDSKTDYDFTAIEQIVREELDDLVAAERISKVELVTRRRNHPGLKVTLVEQALRFVFCELCQLVARENPKGQLLVILSDESARRLRLEIDAPDVDHRIFEMALEQSGFKFAAVSIVVQALAWELQAPTPGALVFRVTIPFCESTI